MRIAVIASEKVYKYLTENHPNIDWNKINNLSDLNGDFQYDLAINFDEDAGKLNYTNIQIPMLINSVCNTLKQFGHAETVIRFNGWETFLSRKAWEMSGKKDEKVEALFLLMGIKPIWLADEPGFVAARVLAMIINEAYFAKQENVSSEEEMNIALKLGTNYPKGPFEWKAEIGIHPIYNLLQVLSLSDNRYTPAASLKQEAETV
jgi:3-hydroxybutyryl-CoA dehydrogenase